ncbi:MAG TPA: sialate O-acetylesterase [Flavisolibacter sp.]|jgi:sialate O-acetylesterase|nr:sialate O-acetylesterase [Flavisolibacter sp.]
MTKALFFFLMTLLSATAGARIVLPAEFNSHMVLQRNSATRFRGWGNPGEKIIITPSWSNKPDSVKVNNDGKWMLSIPTPGAGGPYTITFRGENTIELTDILIGEVWICSGQSNMEYNYYWGLPDMTPELPSIANNNIRFFNIPRTSAYHPQEDVKAQWTVCDSNTVKSFSAVGYYFGRRLNQELNVPIGLINASWGGSPAEAWTPAELVNGDPVLKAAALQQPATEGWPIIPGYTFNGMINPITDVDIAGAIWYQGESNTTVPKEYDKLLKIMIDAWRKEWKKDFPFYLVQIAPFNYNEPNQGALLREAQVRVLQHPNTGMVVTTDIAGDVSDIHPKNKRDVGLRLANLALEKTYQKNIPAQTPLYKSMEVVKGKAWISFDHVYTDLMIKGRTLNEIYIAGADRIFHPARATITDKKLVVWSKEVKQPVAVRFGFSNAGVGNLFSKEGLPVSPFRTDDW